MSRGRPASTMDFKDYYQVLGVERTASAGAIKKAFRSLARQHHPDLNPAPDAAARMQALNEAYEVLRDSDKRAAYDRLGSGARHGQPFEPPPGWDPGRGFGAHAAGAADEGDHSAFFEALFGAAARHAAAEAAAGNGARAGRAAQGRRGPDHHARIEVPLVDAFRGATRTITLHRPAAEGAGQGGLEARTLEVGIPMGIRAGQQIRLAGQGSAGLGDGPDGDLFLEVAFEPHPLWRADGRDIRMPLPVTPWEAALGATVELPTPAGPVSVQVPAASQTGRSLRLRGRGIPGREPGDLYLRLEVALPPANDEPAREAYRALARALPFDPRSHFAAQA